MNFTSIISLKIFLLSICFFQCLNVYCQKDIDNLKFKKHTIYLFSRGTKTKSGLIADKFNISDKNITHVGIGFIKNDSLKIYNVIDCDTDIKLLKDQLKPGDDGVPYFYVIDLNGKIVEVVSGKYTEGKMDKIQEAID